MIYLIAMFGDFLLMRSIKAQVEAIGGEGRRIVNERYQTQDRALIAEAEAEGYHYRILLPLLIEETDHLSELSRDVRVAPLGLEANSKLFICNEGHGPLKITTDRFGFRNPDSVWDTQDSELVLVGDSFAFGVCQQDSKTIAGLLGGRYDTRNLSFPGATAVHYAAMLKTFGPTIDADKVVMIFYANDNMPIAQSQLYHDLFFGAQADASDFFADPEMMMPNPALQNIDAAARSQVLAGKQADKPHRTGFLARNLQRVEKVLSHYNFPGVRSVVASVRRAQVDATDSVELAVQTLNDHCAAMGCSPLIIYIPNSQFWDPDARSAEFAELVAQISGVYDIPFIDFTNDLNALGRETAYADAGIHLSETGYALVAEAISNFFESENTN
ncbi:MULTISPECIES: GDSL-type esterase/lipase family protein [unclassified Ruegeria]|uniref:SGNH/GDSL hydrolase family protein n=1 Tax=unclassified Ruegeria TaxID=2625375 RepID=UPI001488B218